jgi:RHS repeat-associated protein
VHTDTDYLDGFQYKNNVLEFFGHAEGFVANNSNILKYVFQYKDQVGNVRVSYAANTITGQAEILEENHYYPYGLKHAGYGLNTTDQNAAYKYRYNSREWQNELDINFTSMDFRLYDNALGRFFGIDALSEQNHYLSTYQFGDGNPVIFSDPSGLSSNMPEWLRDLWDATPNGYNSTWTNTGGGNFQMTNFWGSGQAVNSIDAGPSGGGGSGGGSALGGGFSGLPSFGVGTVYNVNSMTFTKPNGSMYQNYGNGLWFNGIILPGVTITGSSGNLKIPVNEIINQINAAQSAFNSAHAGGNGGFSNSTLNGFDWVSNISSIASAYPTIDGVWRYHSNASNTWWRGKNGNYYNKNSVRFNGGYKNSLAIAKNSSKLIRGVGGALTGVSVVATLASTYSAFKNGTDNTSTIVGATVGIGLAALTIVGSPVIVTGAAIAGAVWGISQLVAGDQINGWIDNNFGYRD